MCIGVPMKIIEAFDFSAVAQTEDGQTHSIDTLLTGQVSTGTWVLTFLGSAREIVSPARAHEINQALKALNAANAGLPFEHLVSDLIDRDPTDSNHSIEPKRGK